MAKRDYYEVLGIAKGADDATIKKAYRTLAKKNHPDVNPGDKDAEERFGLPVKSFVGGLHLRGNSSRSLSCPKSHVIRIADMLNESSLEKLYTCHCTGFKAFSILKEHLSEKILIK